MSPTTAPKKSTLVPYDEAHDRPSIESILIDISSALALAAGFQHAVANAGDMANPVGLDAAAARALASVCVDAWLAAGALTEALPGKIANLCLVRGDDEDAS